MSSQGCAILISLELFFGSIDTVDPGGITGGCASSSKSGQSTSSYSGSIPSWSCSGLFPRTLLLSPLYGFFIYLFQISELNSIANFSSPPSDSSSSSFYAILSYQLSMSASTLSYIGGSSVGASSVASLLYTFSSTFSCGRCTMFFDLQSLAKWPGLPQP